MFIDEIKIHAVAGAGGDGVVRWRQEKFIDRGGPNGGDGGRGGDVYAFATRDIHALSRYRHERSFVGERGSDGAGGSRHGKDGKDLILPFPVGSIIKHRQTGKSIALVTEGQKELLLKGGRGGFGNEHYKSSLNTTPKKATKGRAGEASDFEIVLELFADVGLIGLPNAGKSSLLNALTNSRAKVGDYAFTTLDPNLGDFYGYVLADIPGLIEGASEGKGLGTKFLRHIKRTKMLVHLVSFENDSMMKTYKAVRAELKAFDPTLAKKDEIIILTKTDAVDDPKLIAKKKKEFEKLSDIVLTLSLYDDASVKNVSDTLIKYLRKQG